MFSQAARQSVSASPGDRIIPFPTVERPDDRDSVVVAAVLLALEAEPLFAPVILAARGMDGVCFVGASIGARAYRLTPAEARLTADAICADPGQLGALETADRFRDAARKADRAFLRGDAL